jgi:hypothetical protein
MAKRAKKHKKTVGRRATTRRRTVRKPPNGFRTWSAYMASIRPTNRGGTVAKKRKAKRATSGKSRTVAVRLPARRAGAKRRSARAMFTGGGATGSPFSVGGILSRATSATMRAGTMLGAEIGVTFIRQRALPKALPGSAAATVADVVISTVAGIAAEKVLGRQIGADVTTGGYLAALRRGVKSLGIKAVNDVLGDYDNGRPQFRLEGGKWVPLNGYVGTGDQRLSGYVGTGDQRPTSVLAGEQETELGY